MPNMGKFSLVELFQESVHHNVLVLGVKQDCDSPMVCKPPNIPLFRGKERLALQCP